MTLNVVIKKYFLLCLGSLMLVILLFIAFAGPYLPFIDSSLKEHLFFWFGRIPMAPPLPPSKDFIMGTDRLGRDLASLLVMGAKPTLMFVVLITLFRYLLAIPLAFLAHKKIWGAQGLLSFLNGYFSYIPTVIIFIAIASLPPLLTLDSRPIILMFILGFLETGRAAAMLKDEFDDVSNQYFMEAGIAVGAPPLRMLRFYYLPFLYDKILISIITDMGKVMFLLGQAGILGSYLSQRFEPTETGFGLVNTSVAWPDLFDKAFGDMRGRIWIVLFPCLAITYTIFTFNILAKGLQKLLK